MTLIKDAEYRRHLARLAATAPELPQAAADGIRLVIGRDLHRFREQAIREAARQGSDAA